MIRIIDHKKVDLTDDEWRLYQEICKAYTKPNSQGSHLFSGLFETDDNGIILFVRPPTQYCTMEVVVYVMSVMQHQHLRIMHRRVDEAIAEMKTEARKALQEEFEKRREP